VQAARELKEQSLRLEELRLSADALLAVADKMKEEHSVNMQDIAKLSESIDARLRSVELMKSSFSAFEGNLEKLRLAVEQTDYGQAQNIRQILLNWDDAGGPKRIAAETFSRLDSNHDGRLKWEKRGDSSICTSYFSLSPCRSAALVG